VAADLRHRSPEPPGRVVAEGLTKRFRHSQRRAGSFKEAFIQALRGRWNRNPPDAPNVLQRSARRYEVLALDALDLTIEPGESLAIVGANGSGKSTLLKLIAGITPPSAGAIRVGGRVASLLELGAGFHPELSGLDNIYQMGALMGMSWARIRTRLDEIAGFSGLGGFLSMPLKHYSTGMAVRLGFAVAIHLEPDIILLDEILAVGDSEFQQRSFDAVSRLREAGRTVVLVTHDPAAAEALCDKALWLDHGRVRARGATAGVLRQFRGAAQDEIETLRLQPINFTTALLQPAARMGSGAAEIESVEIMDAAGRATRRLVSGETMQVRIRYRLAQPVETLACVLACNALDETPLWVVATEGDTVLRPPKPAGQFNCMLRPLPLGAGAFRLSVSICPEHCYDNPYDLHLRVYPFEVVAKRPQWLRPVANLPCALSVRQAD